jgi:hypothetical protein
MAKLQNQAILNGEKPPEFKAIQCNMLICLNKLTAKRAQKM